MLDDFDNSIYDEVQTINKDYTIGDALSEYENDIKDYNILTKEQEKSLFERYHQVVGKEKIKIRNEIATHYLKFVIYVANKYKNKFLSFEDMVSEGNIGLLKAIDKFDENKGTRFTTFSIHYIRSEIKRRSYNQSRLITIPDHMQEKLNKYIRYVETYFSEFNVYPRREVVSRKINVSLEDILELEKIMKSPVSFSTPIQNDGDKKAGSLLDVIKNEKVIDPKEEVEISEMKYQIQEILKDFSQQERELILIRYGFYDNEKKSLSETANILYEQGYTKRLLTGESIRLKENKILVKLRNPKYMEKLKA